MDLSRVNMKVGAAWQLLRSWKDDNDISYEMSRKGVVANLLEELTEHKRAELDKDITKMIDAKCDLIVFALNAIEDLKSLGMLDYLNMELHNWSAYDSDVASYIATLLQMEAFPEQSNEEQFVNNLKNIIGISIVSIEGSGYDWEMCMNETIKQISSRTGKMDYTIGKWIKDKTPEAKAREYQANYTICKKK